MEFPVDVLASVGHEELESSAHSYMSDLLYSNPDHGQYFTLTTGRKVRISLSNVGFVPLYGTNLKHKVLALFSPEDQFTAVALLLDDKWYSVDDILRTTNSSREGLVKVRSVGERVVLYVLNRIVYRTNEMSAGEMPFLCHGENDFAKILWKNGEAVGFYSVKPKGSVCSNFVSQSYLLPVMDSIFVRRAHRGQGYGLQMLEDFVDSFKDDELGIKFPLSPAMSQVCRNYLDRYPADLDLLWEVEGVGGLYQRTRLASKLSAPTLKGRLFSCGKDDSKNGQTSQDRMEMTEETSINITEEIIVVNKRVKAAEEMDDTAVSTRTRSSEHKRKKRMREENEESVAESQPEKICRVEEPEPVLAPAAVMLEGKEEDGGEEAEDLVPADGAGEETVATEAPAIELESEEQALEVNGKMDKEQEEELNEEVEAEVGGEEAQKSKEAESVLQNGTAGEEEEGMDVEEPVQEKDGMDTVDIPDEAATEDAKDVVGEKPEEEASPEAEEQEHQEAAVSPAADDEDRLEEDAPPAAEGEQKGTGISGAEEKDEAKKGTDKEMKEVAPVDEEKLDATPEAADKLEVAPETDEKLEVSPEAEEEKLEVSPSEAEEKLEVSPEAEEKKLDVSPSEADEKLEVSPPEDEEEKLEVYPPEAEEEEVEVSPPEAEEEKLEVSPPEDEEEKLEVSPPEAEEEEVEVSPPEAEEEKLEVSPPEDEEEKLEVSPLEDEEEKLEVSPPETEEKKLEISPPESEEEKLEVSYSGDKLKETELPELAAEEPLEAATDAPSKAQGQEEVIETEEYLVEQEAMTEASEELSKEGSISAVEEDECKGDSPPALDVRVQRGGRSKAVRSSKRLSRKEVLAEGGGKEEEKMEIDKETEMAPAGEEKAATMTEEEAEHSSEEEEEPPVIDRRVLRGKIKVIQTTSQPRSKRRSRI